MLHVQQACSSRCAAGQMVQVMVPAGTCGTYASSMAPGAEQNMSTGPGSQVPPIVDCCRQFCAAVIHDHETFAIQTQTSEHTGGRVNSAGDCNIPTGRGRQASVVHNCAALRLLLVRPIESFTICNMHRHLRPACRAGPRCPPPWAAPPPHLDPQVIESAAMHDVKHAWALSSCYERTNSTNEAVAYCLSACGRPAGSRSLRGQVVVTTGLCSSHRQADDVHGAGAVLQRLWRPPPPNQGPDGGVHGMKTPTIRREAPPGCAAGSRPTRT